MLRSIITVILCCYLLGLAGCVTRPGDAIGRAVHRCEAFFIYEICIADYDHNGSVDYIYFGDDLQIFMFAEAMLPLLDGVQPFHACAVPMSSAVRKNSSRLLYGDELSLSERLAIKGRLIGDYRSAQPAIDACNAAREGATPSPYIEDPFIIDEDWEDWATQDST